MNQPGATVRDDEPSRSSRGGSVVFSGLQRREALEIVVPITPETAPVLFQGFNARAEFDPARDPLPAQPFGAGDAMRWSPPADGEDTPLCPT